MIAKRQEPRSKGEQRRKFRHYDYRRLGNYCRDADHKGEKCLMSWFAGCNAPDYDLALEEIKATQAMNTRVRSDKTYHLEVSFRPEDEIRLAPEAYERIERAFAEALGLSEHQRVCGVHKNTNNLHMHIAYNLIHPDRLTMATTLFYDYEKLSRACRAMEKEFGLTADNGYEQRNTQKGKISQHAAALEAHTGEQSFQSYVLSLKSEIMRRMSTARNWQDAHQTLAEYGIAIKPKANGFVLAPLNDKGGSLKASSLDKSMSRMRMEQRFGTFVTSETRQPSQSESEPELPRAGARAFRDVVLARRAAITADLEQARNWQDVHDILANHGLEIKPLGAGLVLASQRSPETLKASALDRNMSRMYLEKRFGSYAAPESGQRQQGAPAADARQTSGRRQEEPKQEFTAGKRTYQKSPRQPRNPERDRLYLDYQAALAEKIARIDAEKARNEASREWLKGRWQRMKEQLYAEVLTRRTRAIRMRMMLNLHRQDVLQARAGHKAAMAGIRADYPWYNWNGYLQHQATQGNTVALGVLRSMEERKAAQAAIRNPAREKTFLEVQFDDRQAAKAAGAKWDPQAKHWYAPRGSDLDKVSAWLPRSGEKAEEAAREHAARAATAAPGSKEETPPGQRLARLAEIEALRIKRGGADISLFTGHRYRIDNRGVVIITLASGGAIRDAGDTLHFTPDAKTRQAARLYAQTRFGSFARETENSIERNESACRRFKRLYSPDLNVLKECTRHGVRALSKLAVVFGWKKPEVLLQDHARHDLER